MSAHTPSTPRSPESAPPSPLLAFAAIMRRSWQQYFRFGHARDTPFWARALLTLLVGLAFPTFFMLLEAGLRGQWPSFKAWWLSWLLGILIASCIHGLFALSGALLPRSVIERLTCKPSWPSGVFFTAIPVLGTVIGMLLGQPLLSWVAHTEVRIEAFESLRGISKFLLISTAISIGWALWVRYRWQRNRLRLQATEAQLRLLQAQIEPHFLFNTLANVQSLIDHDTPRAKQMLEAFTDYLRASLGQLRGPDSSVGLELDMAQSYLQLLQIRMAERLNFSIEADAQARSAVLPPLLLQPLIENAIHHGLEPKIEGGTVRVQARVSAGRLELRVEDDGLGLHAPRRKHRAAGARGDASKGHGLALGNIRARLQALYPDNASLTLTEHPSGVGTLAVMSLPWLEPSAPEAGSTSPLP